METNIAGMKESAAKAQDLYEEGLEKGRELVKAASKKSTEAMDLTYRWARSNPWVALGMAAGVGLLVGLLLDPGRRNKADR